MIKAGRNCSCAGSCRLAFRLRTFEAALDIAARNART
jgi:hypothetical protein